MEITKKTANDCANHITDLLKPVLKLDDWRFDWRWEQMDRLSEGEVQYGAAHVGYNDLQAIIFVDTSRHEDDFTEFVDTIRHEMLHSTHFMWSRFINMLQQMLPEEHMGIAGTAWRDACEEHVAYTGRILDNLGYSVEELATSCLVMLAEKANKE